LVKSCEHAVSLFFKLIGWHISDDPKKSSSFAEHFVALGVCFTIGSWSSTISTVSNLDTRVNKVCQSIQDIISKKTMTHKQAEVLRGKLQYMDTQVFGRVGKSLIKPLYDGSFVSDVLDSYSMSVLKELEKWLNTSSPRIITPPPSGPTFLLFTDGASEFAHGNLKLSIGAVLFVQGSNWSEVLSSDVPTDEVNLWQELESTSNLRRGSTKDKLQFITEAELVAVLVSLQTWIKVMSMRRVIIFVDSDPAKFSLIRGTSNSIACADIVKRTHLLISEASLHVWITRVPTKSNPADDPSRGKPEETMKLYGSKLTEAVWST
jgi:hypothetical protein